MSTVGCIFGIFSFSGHLLERVSKRNFKYSAGAVERSFFVESEELLRVY